MAVAIAAFAVWRVARWLIGSAWLVAGWDDIAGVGEWALDRWPLVALALALVFVAVFGAVRALIRGWRPRAAQTAGSTR